MIKNIIPTLAEVGKIKIGRKGPARKGKEGREYRLPQKDDHFTITGLARDANDDFVVDSALMASVGSATGQQPGRLTALPVRLLYDDIDLNFPTSYACYKTKAACWCRGDGEEASRIDERTGEVKTVKCPCERQAPTYKGADKCKITGCLAVVLDGVPVVGGVWKFRTTSWNSVVNILSSLQFIRSLTGGVLSGVPLFMVVAPKTVSIPDGSGQTTVFVVRLEYRGTAESLSEIGYSEAKRRAVAQIKMADIEAEARAQRQIAGADEITEASDIVEEFFPEVASAPVVPVPNDPGTVDHAPLAPAPLAPPAPNDPGAASPAPLAPAMSSLF